MLLASTHLIEVVIYHVFFEGLTQSQSNLRRVFMAKCEVVEAYGPLCITMKHPHQVEFVLIQRKLADSICQLRLLALLFAFRVVVPQSVEHVEVSGPIQTLIRQVALKPRSAFNQLVSQLLHRRVSVLVAQGPYLPISHDHMCHLLEECLLLNRAHERLHEL